MQITQDYRVLTPAYGRDYKSKAAVQADWDANLDFRIQPENMLINKQQFSPGVKVNIRYGKLMKVTVVTA